jgi:hypothetical protein
MPNSIFIQGLRRDSAFQFLLLSSPLCRRRRRERRGRRRVLKNWVKFNPASAPYFLSPLLLLNTNLFKRGFVIL